MMMSNASVSVLRQRGVALVVALVFLLVVTIISVIAASNSSLGLKMSANLQDSYSSFQSAEAGILAVMALRQTDNDPFNKESHTPDPFSMFNNSIHPLRALNDGADTVQVEVFFTTKTDCPRKEKATSGKCYYYHVVSEHEVIGKARSKVQAGVVTPFPPQS